MTEDLIWMLAGAGVVFVWLLICEIINSYKTAKKCPKCGKRNSFYARRCERCGAELGGEQYEVI